MKTLWNLITEHPLKFFAIVLGLIILYLVYGCEPRTASVIDPARQVNKYELKAELDLVVTRFENKFQDIAQQEEFRKALFDTAINMFITGQIDPLGVVMTLASVLGLGALGDDVRLRKKLKLTVSAQPAMALPVAPPT